MGTEDFPEEEQDIIAALERQAMPTHEQITEEFDSIEIIRGLGTVSILGNIVLGGE